MDDDKSVEGASASDKPQPAPALHEPIRDQASIGEPAGQESRPKKKTGRPRKAPDPKDIREWLTLWVSFVALVLGVASVNVAQDANAVQGYLADLEEHRELAKFSIVGAMAVTIGVTDNSQQPQSQILLRVENRGGHASAIHAIRIRSTMVEGNTIGHLGSTIYDSPVLVFNFTEGAQPQLHHFSRSIQSGEQTNIGIAGVGFLGATKLSLTLEPVLGKTVSRELDPPFGPRFGVDFRVPPGTPHYEAHMK